MAAGMKMIAEIDFAGDVTITTAIITIIVIMTMTDRWLFYRANILRSRPAGKDFIVAMGAIIEDITGEGILKFLSLAR